MTFIFYPIGDCLSDYIGDPLRGIKWRFPLNLPMVVIPSGLPLWANDILLTPYKVPMWLPWNPAMLALSVGVSIALIPINKFKRLWCTKEPN